jgi:hypothetical protein
MPIGGGGGGGGGARNVEEVEHRRLTRPGEDMSVREGEREGEERRRRRDIMEKAGRTIGLNPIDERDIKRQIEGRSATSRREGRSWP